MMLIKTVEILFLLVLNGQITWASIAQQKNCMNCPHLKSFLTCDPDSCDWLILNGYWAGNTSSNGSLLIGGCPNDYIYINASSTHVWIPANLTETIEQIGDFLCNKTNRMGVLCGQCQPGYAPAINADNFDCVKCSKQNVMTNWIYYILSFYVPHLLIFIIIILFNIRLTTGPVNAFILYAQVISTSLNVNDLGGGPLGLVYGENANAFQQSYQIPYGLFNLNTLSNVFPLFCVSETLNELDLFFLKYLEALFPVLIIILTNCFIKCQERLNFRLVCCSCCKKCKIATSLEYAFVAFVLLTYNRLCQITIYLITPVYTRNSDFQGVERRFYFKGNYLYDDSNYVLHYKLLAYIILAVLILMPILLLHYPLIVAEKYILLKVKCLKKLYPGASISILLDTFQGCYKHNRRYFAGLYLVFRLLFFVAYYLPELQGLFLQQVLVTLYIFLIGFLQPYKEDFFNRLDISIFSNLALVNMIVFFLVSSGQNGADTMPIQICVIIVSVLIFLPLIYLCVYLIWNFTRRYHDCIKARISGCYKSATNARTVSKPIELPDHNKPPINEVDFIVITERAAEKESKF